MKRIVKVFLIILLVFISMQLIIVAKASNHRSDQYNFEIKFKTSDFISLNNIKVDIYDAYVEDIDDGGTIVYGHNFICSVYSSFNGIAYVNKPSDKFLIMIDLSSLPSEYGVEKSNYFIEEGNDIQIEVLKVDTVQYVDDELCFYSTNNKQIQVEYTIETKNENLYKNDIIFSDKAIIKKEINYGKKVIINKEHDLSNYSQKEKVDYFYNNNYISEEVKIDKYCDILINKEFDNIHCLSEMFYVIEQYKQENDTIPFVLNEKINYVLGDEGGLRTRPNTNRTYSSTNFKIHYRSTYCSDSVAQAIANYMEGIRSLFISNYFQTPILEFLSTRYHIYLDHNENGATLGTCFKTTSNKTSASYIVIYEFDNELNDEFRDTLSHEYFHAIQYSYNSTVDWFAEATAEWAGLFGSGYQNQFVGWLLYMYQSNTGYCNFNKSIYDSQGYETAFLALTLDECYCGAETLSDIYGEIGDLPYNYSFSDLAGAIDNYLDDSGFDETFENVITRAYVRLSQPFYLFDSLTGYVITAAPNFSTNVTNIFLAETLEPYSGSLYRIKCDRTDTYRITATIGMSGYPFTASYVRRATSTNGNYNYYAYYKFSSNPLTFTNYLFGTNTCDEICLVPTYFGSSNHSYTLSLQVTLNS